MNNKNLSDKKKSQLIRKQQTEDWNYQVFFIKELEKITNF